ncbi:LytTR family DNA-binding domain-containing protein [Paratractidigestivibacter sp.]|uniref:LytR/AlgR family response regulator transcription factor n=1 Tax=Paratractidigestivibacter sp. TaxID=2847316 RepID=UPI002AC8CDB3|nr:LytTR family DNA-binding domain-containing protein [Paratractidigestivibacter sp.]
MLQFHIAVCDDEPFAAASISGAADRELLRLGAEARIESFGDVAGLAARVQEEGFDLILLDIEMPQVNGLEFARALRSAGNKTEIVFVSNSEDRVFESLPLRPLAFVRKSHFTEDMAQAIQAFVRSWKSLKTDRVVTLKMAHAMGTFSVDDIIYVEARRRDKILHMVNGRTEVVIVTLEELGEKLAPVGFCRVHKGFLVNFAHVSQLSSKGIVMDNGESIPISRGTIKEVKLAYMDFLSNKNAVVM